MTISAWLAEGNEISKSQAYGNDDILCSQVKGIHNRARSSMQNERIMRGGVSCRGPGTSKEEVMSFVRRHWWELFVAMLTDRASACTYGSCVFE